VGYRGSLQLGTKRRLGRASLPSRTGENILNLENATQVHASVKFRVDNTVDDILITIPSSDFNWTEPLGDPWIWTNDIQDLKVGFDNGDFEIIEIIAYY